MSEAGRKRWWRAVAGVVVGGGALAVAWFGVIRDAVAEPLPQVTVPTGNENWVPRLPPPVATLEPPAVAMTDSKVIPAAVPTIAQPTALPALPVMPAAAQSPAVAALPPAELPPLPNPPVVSPIKPLGPFGPEPVAPQLPSMVGGLLPIKPVDSKQEVPAVPPPSGVVPPVVPAVIPPPEVPPPAALPKLPDLPRPAVPSVSGLPGANAGATVKPEPVGGGTGLVQPALPVLPPPIPQADPVKPPVVPAIPAVGGPGNTVGTPVDLAKPPVLPLPRDTGPSIPISPLVPTPGDNTMLHLNKAAALAAIGGALMFPAPQANAAPVVPVPISLLPGAQTDGKVDLPELKKKVDEANNKLTEIQRDLTTLTELLKGKKDEKGFPLASDPGLVAQMKEFKDKLNDLQTELDKMKTQTSLRPPAPVTPDPKAGKGTVRIVNEYPVRVSIVVNGTSYRVEPSKSLDIEVIAGEFTYQLLESGAASTKSTIKEKETVTLRIK